MPNPRPAVLLLGIAAASCESYAPAPVDLNEHARRFASRLPDTAALGAFVAELRESAPVPASWNGEESVQREEARWIALLINPDLRVARLEAGIAGAIAENSGLLEDPTLNGTVLRILESASDPWIPSASLGISLPLSGRLGLESDLADERFVQARTEARLAEARTMDEIDRVWLRWSAAVRRMEILQELLAALLELERIAKELAASDALTNVEARIFTMERWSRAAESIRTRAQVDVAVLELKRLLGLPPESSLVFEPSLDVPVLYTDAATRRSSLTLGREVVRAERAYAVAERDLELEVAEQWPDLTLFPTWQPEEDQQRAGIGFSLPLPIWNANARAIAESRARRLMAEQALRSSLERSEQQLALSEVQVEAARRQRELVESELVPLAAEQLARGRDLIAFGQLDVLLILDAVRRVYEAKSAALDAALSEGLAIVERNALFWPELASAEVEEEKR